MSRSTQVAGAPQVTVDDRRAPPGDGAVEPAGLAELLGAVLALEGVPQGAEAGLHLVDRAEMTALNSVHMGAEGPTDVLSFPVDGGDQFDVPDRTPRTDHSAVPVLVGDVVLCPEVAGAQAADHAGSWLEECRLLVVHGGLHLCGWDHRTDAERAAMWRRERELMSALGIVPSGDPWSSP